MAEQQPTTLKLENAQGFMRKIANNLLNFGEEKVTAFTLPIEGIELTPEALDELLGPYTHRAWFEKRKDGSLHPMPFWSQRKNADFQLDVELDCAGVELIVSGKELVFEAEEADKDDEDSEARPAARITDIRLTPKAGGQTLLAFHLQIRPGLGKENLELQRHQHRHLTITLGDVSVAKHEEKQQSLPLASGEGDAPDTVTVTSGRGKRRNGGANARQ